MEHNASGVTLLHEKIDGSPADVLLVKLRELSAEYEYIGLWYACDKNEDTFIATEFHYGANDGTQPAVQKEEISENSFKKTPRIALSAAHDALWIAARVEREQYCRMKLFPFVAEKSFINYKVINNRGSAFDTLKTGVLKGDTACFYRIGIEDNTGVVDYNDAIFFLVCITSLPPEDWKFDPSFFGVQKLPMVVPAFIFSNKGAFSRWFGQDPLQGIG